MLKKTFKNISIIFRSTYYVKKFILKNVIKTLKTFFECFAYYFNLMFYNIRLTRHSVDPIVFQGTSYSTVV